MIRPPGFRGAAFGTARDGDARVSLEARAAISAELGISSEWAFIRQVHGSDVLTARDPGLTGEGDALVTSTPGLPLAVATADCVPVIVEGATAVAVIHAGWRGLAAGVIGAALDRLVASGSEPERAAVGPAIGPCCYEVGEEVLAALEPHAVTTRSGAPGVDLWSAATTQLGSLGVWRDERCTSCGGGFHSYRRSGTPSRQVAVGWLPSA